MFLGSAVTVLYGVGTWFLLGALHTSATVAAAEGVDAELEFIRKVLRVLLVSFGLSAVVLLSGIRAPYGRYYDGQALQWAFGLQLPGRICWVLQEAPCVVASSFAALEIYRAGRVPSSEFFLLLMFACHYVNRTLIFPFRIKGGKPTTAMAFLMAMAFCAVNGYIQARCLTGRLHSYPDVDHPLFALGTLLWFLGVVINVHSDGILLNLRSKSADKAYYVPQGGLFAYVSCPNFLGEMIEWAGFAVATGFAPHAVTFAVCTACNLFPRALQHHQFYLKKFEDKYPRGRRAVIPYII